MQRKKGRRERKLKLRREERRGYEWQGGIVEREGREKRMEGRKMEVDEEGRKAELARMDEDG